MLKVDTSCLARNRRLWRPNHHGTNKRSMRAPMPSIVQPFDIHLEPIDYISAGPQRLFFLLLIHHSFPPGRLPMLGTRDHSRVRCDFGHLGVGLLMGPPKGKMCQRFPGNDFSELRCALERVWSQTRPVLACSIFLQTSNELYRRRAGVRRF